MSAGPSRGTLLGLVAALGALALSAPDPISALSQVRAASTATDPTGPVVAALALLAWGVGLWLALTALLVLAARAPGARGRAAARMARRVAPAAVRRSVELTLGLSITLGTIGAVPASAATSAAPVSTAAGSLPSAAAGLLPAPDLDWPAPTAVPAPPVAPSPVLTTHETAGQATPELGADTVVVQPGDTLWALAETRLRQTGTPAPTDRQIASSWPLWWSANRQVIGDDPDLIRPGAVLRPPPTSS